MRSDPRSKIAPPKSVWIIVGLCVFSLWHAPLEAANYYVATNGSNANSGTSVASPFLTIQQAANVAQAGDNVYVRGGTYRETVTLPRSGLSGSPISFQSYNNEQVTVTGLDQLNSGWTQYSGSIYQATAAGGASQVFLGGKPMIEARSSITSSGASYNNPLRRTYSTVDSAVNPANPDGSLSRSGLTITSSAITNPPAGTSWVGAKVAFIGGPEYGTNCGSIVSQAGGTITYNVLSPNVPDYLLPGTGNRFYLYDSLAALDSPKEWYYNGSQLYLQAPNGLTPNGQNVEVRTRTNGFDLNNKSYVNLSGFKLQAATINVGGDHNLIDNCQIFYPCPSVDVPRAYDSYAGVLISGQYNTVRHSEVAYSWGSGVTLKNSHNTVENNVVHDCNGNGTYTACIDSGDSPGNNLIQNNTTYNSGAADILLAVNKMPPYDPASSPNNQVLHNDISRSGYLVKDLGALYTFNSDISGTVIAYNRVHDQRGDPTFKGGIYLDDSVSGATVHHNLVYNVTRGIYSKGTNGVYNNTIWNTPDAAVASYYTGSNTTVTNNLANNDIQGQQGSNNRNQTVDQFTNSAAGDYTLTANSSGTNTGPTRKRAVDYGVVIPGITDIDGYAGSNPDAGAIERGITISDAHNVLTAGANWKAWTAGNQATVPLSAALYVTQSGTRVATGSLMVGNTGSTSANSRSFLNFDLSGIVSTTIASAILRIYENTLPTSDTGSVTLNRVTSAWTNANVSYNQPIDTGAAITGFYDPANLDLYTDINITSWVQGWLSNSAANYGLRLCGTEDVAGTAKYFDGFYGVTAPQLVLTLATPGDVNLDGRVDVSDLAILAANYRKHVTGGWAQADFNNDGLVDVQDLAVLAANYRYGVASTITPGPVPWDAEATALLSQAGVTMVPETGTLVMLATALIGLLAYAWRKRR